MSFATAMVLSGFLGIILTLITGLAGPLLAGLLAGYTAGTPRKGAWASAAGGAWAGLFLLLISMANPGDEPFIQGSRALAAALVFLAWMTAASSLGGALGGLFSAKRRV